MTEIADLTARRRWWSRHLHVPVLVLASERTEAVPPYVFVTELARCGRCGAPIVRVCRYGPGSDGDTGWQTAP